MKVTVAAVRMACSNREDENLEKADDLVRQAAAAGANIVLLQEMFSTMFFGMQDWSPDCFELASTAEESVAVRHMSSLAAELGVVVPVSFFERANQSCFNSVMIIDSRGKALGIYRKSHMPVGPSRCVEKYCTTPGNTGLPARSVQPFPGSLLFRRTDGSDIVPSSAARRFRIEHEATENALDEAVPGHGPGGGDVRRPTRPAGVT